MGIERMMVAMILAAAALSGFPMFVSWKEPLYPDQHLG
jgi:hypothetical protein